ncbi:MAG: thiamine-phosphate diphosphorylase [Verrucomicrobia bacterium Tous-C9LFEB]|nr:MAG: thiamine-phosphate diphosphorylase [Verrucomicrobia bacterium Tous-C9LFEB]
MAFAPNNLLIQRRERLARSRFYAILDLSYLGRQDPVQVVEDMTAGGVDIIQLRGKNASEKELAAMCEKVMPAIADAGALFILNDHPTLAAEIGTDGAHIGQDDGGIPWGWSQLASDQLLGVSTHSVEQALEAAKDEPDYIGVGPIFATPTKPDYAPVGLPLIGQVKAAVKMPQFCIGGVNLDTLPQVLAAGADRVVVVSAILQSGDVLNYCRRVRALLDATPGA